MNWKHPLHAGIDLFGHDRSKSRIRKADADRQEYTARILLERLQNAPGQILADEVGMGKTYVSLAVAASVALNHEQPVALMVPPGVLEKWQRDFDVFHKNYLPPGTPLRHAVAQNGVDFLKLLDDPAERRCHLIFLPHGALSRNMQDHWVKFALIQRCMRGRRDAMETRRAVGRYADRLLRRGYITGRAPGIWDELLGAPSVEWRGILQKHLPDEEHDDPVPLAVREALELPSLAASLDALWIAVYQTPRRESKFVDARLKQVRDSIGVAIRELWQSCFLQARIRLPLLVLDEAHHLKNQYTRLASLFQSEDSHDDAEAVTHGALAGVFERMLFLTATPFQLGHNELCNILSRFEGVAWSVATAPPGGRFAYRSRINALRATLDESQFKARRLESCWGRLRQEDLTVDGVQYHDADGWWAHAVSSTAVSDRGRAACEAFEAARDALKRVEQELRHFVVRHARSRHLSEERLDIPRRCRLTGRAVAVADDLCSDLELPGLDMTPDAALPFMLAARLVALTPGSRPVTAEGLASSYEAFLDTRAASLNEQSGSNGKLMDDDVVEEQEAQASDAAWYVGRIRESIRDGDRIRSERHPKIGPVAERVLELWRRGEKVVVFCHYVRTGRALRSHISHLLRAELVRRACTELGISEEEFNITLRRASDIFDKDRPLYRRAAQLLEAQLDEYDNLHTARSRIIEVVIRFLRTPTFLLRYFPKAGRETTPDTLQDAFEHRDGSGLRLADLLSNFFEFLSQRCTTGEREKYLSALESVQTGSLYAQDDAEEGDSRESLLATVRLVNGATKTETREHLMLAFNTPFYPEILVASSVLAEGVDLHLNCRHIIHYDMSWNPSDIEQRTGRIDRLGAKAERAQAPIQVFYPYLAGTQDEKIYRVVMDRERWFNVVMGGTFKVDYQTAEQLADRVPLPDLALKELTLDLKCDDPK